MAADPSTSESSTCSLMTVSELIETAFGDPEKNVVHHKHLQTVLHLLARQLRILERHVSIPKKHGQLEKQRSSSSLSVTEIKLQALTKKYKKETKGLEEKKSITSKESSETIAPTESGKKTSSSTDIRTMGPQDYQKLLDEVEQTRERELRVIRQRGSSREQREKTPTPIASMDSVEATYEKLLIVERVPAEEAEARAAREKTGAQKDGPRFRLPVVTQEEFEALAAKVRELQTKFDPIAMPGFPENAQLMQELRKGASLTNAMAALQLSARLEATEKTLKNMLSLVTNLAKQTSGTDLAKEATDNIKVILDAPDGKRRQTMSEGKSAIALKKRSQSKSKKNLEHGTGSLSEASLAISIPAVAPEKVDEDIGDRLTYDKLDQTLQEFYHSVIEAVNGMTTKSIANADNAFKLASKLEGKLNASLNFGSRMENLESLTNSNAQQINVLDIGLSSQMTNYQEELTKMQNDLEVGMETMTEVLANAGGDATAVAELNAHFTDLQEDIDNTVMRQKELSDTQYSLSMDLKSLRIQIELLRETKSDREEVVDALRDKAGVGALNGLVSHEQFDCVLGDIEKRIKTAYDKFNKQELVWQKAIDDFLWNLNEKADLIQVESLRDEICRYLRDFRAKLNFISEIVGEPEAAALSKKINRESACLSCATPAHMKIDETTVPKLPALRPPAMGAEAPAPSEDGDHGVCYQGYPIPHPRDPRSHFCRRWCGGSHTLVTKKTSRPPSCIIITPAQRKGSREQGLDGKLYPVERPMPCSLCNPKPTPVTSEQLGYNDGSISDMVSYDFRPTIISAPEADVTPPAGLEME